MDFTKLISDYGLIILLVVLLVFMFWSSRRRQAKQKAEQEVKARQTVPGAEVLLQGGLFGTIVEYGPTDLDNALLLCNHHHHRIHDAGHRADRLPNGDIRFHRRR